METPIGGCLGHVDESALLAVLSGGTLLARKESNCVARRSGRGRWCRSAPTWCRRSIGVRYLVRSSLRVMSCRPCLQPGGDEIPWSSTIRGAYSGLMPGDPRGRQQEESTFLVPATKACCSKDWSEQARGPPYGVLPRKRVRFVRERVLLGEHACGWTQACDGAT